MEHNCICRRERRHDLHRRDKRLGSIGVHEHIDLGGSSDGSRVRGKVAVHARQLRIEVSPGSENPPQLRAVSFLHLSPLAISVPYLDEDLLGHGRDGSENFDKANAAPAQIGSHVGRSAPTHHDCCMSRCSVVSHSVLLLMRRRYTRGARRGEKLTMALSLRTEFYAVNH
jgi:hypothetical protein